jgi:regulator of sigma E protease
VFSSPTWLLVIPVLGFLIFVHELGHFITAKRFGIKVTEFGFGFPPRLIGVYRDKTGFHWVLAPFLSPSSRHRGEVNVAPDSTIYSINIIPLGGFVKMVGEEDPTDPRSFARQSVLKRAIVLSAGSFMNLVTPILIFAILFMTPQDAVVGSVTITGVAPRSPAAEAGLRPGDIITQVNGKQVDNHADLIQRVMAKLGSPVELTVRKGAIVSGLGSSPEFSSVETVTVVPRLKPPALRVVEQVADPQKEVSLAEARRYNAQLKVGDTLTQGAIGVMIGTTNPRVVKKSYPVWDAFPMAVQRIWDVVTISKNGIVRWAAGGDDPGLAGPIGIAQVTGEVARVGISPLFEFTALISISLAIMNILPIPALDGGRLLFVVIEWVRRGKRISPQREGLVHLVGFAILLSFIVIISYFDIVRILNGDSLIR